ncbi:GIY-YIG nuclease family protein [Bacillus bombysepticus]|uniref:GIY-YIG nuclease family protein n=1 Tax=Bacillus bombysepticus TaxID=658666 RepID=UPI00301B2D95
MQKNDNGVSNVITISAMGDFLKELKYPGRMKEHSIEFTHSSPIKWDLKVSKSLESKIAVYIILDEKGEIIYVGSAIGKKGLKGRQATHEKKGIFRLFNAKNLVYYYEIGNDPGKILQLERFMIYAHDPILNNDFDTPINLYDEIYKKMKTKLNEMINVYHFAKKQKTADDLDFIREHLESLFIEKEEAYDELVKAKSKKNNKVIKKKEKIYNQKKKEFEKNFSKKTINIFNERYDEYKEEFQLNSK